VLQKAVFKVWGGVVAQFCADWCVGFKVSGFMRSPRSLGGCVALKDVARLDSLQQGLLAGVVVSSNLYRTASEAHQVSP
jgi:hypothetical protein